METEVVAPALSSTDPRVLFEGSGFAIVSKPSGLITHRGPFFRRGPTLHDWARKQFRTNQVDLVHRIDSGTSGLIVLGLSKEATAKIATQFREGTVQKSYQALVRGWVIGSGQIDWPLLRKDKTGYQSAETGYRALGHVEVPAAVGRYRTSRYSLVEFYPRTGRTHQIRRHASHMKHPIVGDVNYGDGPHNRFFRDEVKVHRLLLHASEIQFQDPATSEMVRFRDPWPSEVRERLVTWPWTWTTARTSDTLDGPDSMRPFDL